MIKEFFIICGCSIICGCPVACECYQPNNLAEVPDSSAYIPIHSCDKVLCSSCVADVRLSCLSLYDYTSCHSYCSGFTTCDSCNDLVCLKNCAAIGDFCATCEELTNSFSNCLLSHIQASCVANNAACSSCP